VNPQLSKLSRADGRRRIDHQVDCLGSLGEWNDLTQAVSACKDHHDAVKSKRDSSMRRSSIFECFQKEAEARTRLLVAHSQRIEDLLLNILPVDTD